MGRLDLAGRLVEQGAAIDARDPDGKTPLHWAAQEGHRDVVEFLVTHGADVNARTRSARTPIDLAGFYHHEDVVQYFWDHGGVRWGVVRKGQPTAGPKPGP